MRERVCVHVRVRIKKIVGSFWEVGNERYTLEREDCVGTSVLRKNQCFVISLSLCLLVRCCCCRCHGAFLGAKRGSLY